MRIVIIKLGGSLYDLPDLGARIAALLAPFPDHRFLIFPGGGEAADLVRNWQPRFGWSDAIAHDVAMASLDFNASLLAKILPNSAVVRDREDAEGFWQHRLLPVLAPVRLFSLEEHGDLPRDWTVTSDSLAAWVTLRWPADELWICKSVPRPMGLSIAIQNGAVDPHFADLAADLPRVRWCDLRAGVEIEDWNKARSASDGCS
jgi:5-(aminomethyl)-3-furanmethanol phosphate kinase